MPQDKKLYISGFLWHLKSVSWMKNLFGLSSVTQMVTMIPSNTLYDDPWDLGDLVGDHRVEELILERRNIL